MNIFIPGTGIAGFSIFIIPKMRIIILISPQFVCNNIPVPYYIIGSCYNQFKTFVCFPDFFFRFFLFGNVTGKTGRTDHCLTFIHRVKRYFGPKIFYSVIMFYLSKNFAGKSPLVITFISFQSLLTKFR